MADYAASGVLVHKFSSGCGRALLTLYKIVEWQRCVLHHLALLGAGSGGEWQLPAAVGAPQVGVTGTWH